jgi:hypothetical protein
MFPTFDIVAIVIITILIITTVTIGLDACPEDETTTQEEISF